MCWNPRCIKSEPRVRTITFFSCAQWGVTVVDSGARALIVVCMPPGIAQWRSFRSLAISAPRLHPVRSISLFTLAQTCLHKMRFDVRVVPAENQAHEIKTPPCFVLFYLQLLLFLGGVRERDSFGGACQGVHHGRSHPERPRACLLAQDAHLMDQDSARRRVCFVEKMSPPSNVPRNHPSLEPRERVLLALPKKNSASEERAGCREVGFRPREHPQDQLL